MAKVLDDKLEAKLHSLTQRSEMLSHQLSDPGVMENMAEYRKLSQSYADMQPIIETYKSYCGTTKELEQAQELVRDESDPEMRQMAAEEVKELAQSQEQLGAKLQLLLLPSDPNDAKNVILEVRAGTGGDEATLFAAEIFRMYERFADSKKWKVQISDRSESSVGGLKEVVATIEGDRVYSQLKFESGVHRVQRVPATETQGRVHTSAVTVAILPEAEELDVDIEDKDLKIDTYCASGAGGQHVNRTESAIRITHLPTNIVVQCQDEKSQHKNKARAMKVLRSRLYDQRLSEQQDEIAKERRGMVGSGDRSEKIRTYNFPQSRVTDHRIGLTLHSLPAVMSGEMGELVDALVSQDQADRLRQEIEAE